MKKLNFVIFSPRNTHGGVIVLHVLCGILKDLGYKAKMFYSEEFCYDVPNQENKLYKKSKTLYRFLKRKQFWWRWFKKRLKKEQVAKVNFKIKKKYFPFVSAKTVVIYPEITAGNPLRAKRVVRWFLYHNRYKSCDGAYGTDDLFFTYRPVFNDYDLNPTCRTLKTPYMNLDLYKRTNFGERTGKCYIVRKGRKRPDLPKEFDGPIIDDLPEEEKVKIFNQCEWCISYDTQTAYSGIAAICGCISVVVPEEGKTKADYVKEGDVDYGRAYGFSEQEIQHAINTRDKVLDYYRESNEQSKEEVKKFIQICEEYFGVYERRSYGHGRVGGGG